MVIYLTQAEITCEGCGRTRKTFNPHTMSSNRCASCRNLGDETNWVKFTCDWCHNPKRASTSELAESGICKECVLTCSTCKAHISRGLLTGIAGIRSMAEIEHLRPIPSPSQEHRQTCGRRYCETCADWCIGTLELFNEHLRKHQEQRRAQRRT